MTKRGLRILLSMAGAAGVLVLLGEPVQLALPPITGRVIEEYAYGDSALLIWSGERADYLSRTRSDGHTLWRLRIPGAPVFRSLRADTNRIYLRSLRETDRGVDEWVTAVSPDGRWLWSRLLAEHPGEHRSMYEDADQPVVVGNVLIEEVRFGDTESARVALDTRTGWPLWRASAPPWSLSTASAGAFLVEQDFDHTYVTDVRTGQWATRDARGMGCVIGNELLDLIPSSDHDRLVALDQADRTKIRTIGMLRHHTDDHHAVSLHGCARYGDRVVMLAQYFDEGSTPQTMLIEFSPSGETLVETPVPELELRFGVEKGESPMPLYGDLTRFVPVAIRVERVGSELAILDLDSGSFAWRGGTARRAAISIFRDGGRWLVEDEQFEPISHVLISIDGGTGRIDARAQNAEHELRPRGVGGGHLWLRTYKQMPIDDAPIIVLSDHTLAPQGIRQHILATFDDVPRPLSERQRELSGL